MDLWIGTIQGATQAQLAYSACEGQVCMCVWEGYKSEATVEAAKLAALSSKALYNSHINMKYEDNTISKQHGIHKRLNVCCNKCARVWVCVGRLRFNVLPIGWAGSS